MYYTMIKANMKFKRRYSLAKMYLKDIIRQTHEYDDFEFDTVFVYHIFRQPGYLYWTFAVNYTANSVSSWHVYIVTIALPHTLMKCY